MPAISKKRQLRVEQKVDNTFPILAPNKAAGNKRQSIRFIFLVLL